MAIVNRDALDLMTRMKENVAKITQWQQAFLARMDQLAPKTDGAAAEESDYPPEMLTQLDETSFRRFVEASIGKLMKITK